MKSSAFLLSPFFLLLGCDSPAPETIETQTTPVVTATIPSAASKPAAGLTAQQPAWFEPLLNTYIAHTTDPMVSLNRQEASGVVWRLDRVEVTDTARYYVFQLGHTVIDSETSIEPHFATTGWVWIDSTHQRALQYDVGQDSLWVWRDTPENTRGKLP